MDVAQALAKKSSDQFPSTLVEREDNLNYDLGLLAAFDPKPIDVKEFKINQEQYLQEIARDNVQLVVNRLFKLETLREPGMNGVLAVLPTPVTVLPRARHIPEEKPMTKWQEFAKEKGIKKRKRERFVRDEDTGEERPRHGFNRVGSGKDEWVLEHKESEGFSDPFSKQIEDKKERVAKNLKQQKANKARALKKASSILPAIALSTEHRTSLQDKMANIEKVLPNAQKATISMGKFDKKLKGEKAVKNKAKYEPLMADESTKTERALRKTFKKQEAQSFDLNKAVNEAIRTQRIKKRSQKDDIIKRAKAGGTLRSKEWLEKQNKKQKK